ncbi:MAG: glycosyltransferase family 4 protein [archaeon]
MKACITSMFFEKGYGQGLCVKKLSEGLAERGNEIHVIHGEKEKAGGKNLFYHPLKKISFPAVDIFSFGLGLRKKIRGLDEKIDFDLFYPHSYEFGLIDFNELRKPFVYHARGTVKGNYLNRPKTTSAIEIGRKAVIPLLIKLDEKCCRKAKKIIVDSERVKKEIMEFHGVKGKKIEVIPDGVDLKEFNPKVNGKRIRKQFGLKQNKVILFSGRIVPQKGLQYLIEALPRAIEEISSMKLLVVGNNTSEPYCNTIRKMIKANNLEERVVFAGFVEQNYMPEFIAASDVVVSPSTYEPFGIINLEATAMEKPLITTKLVGSLNAVKESATIIKPHSPKEISNALISLFSGKTKSRKLKKIREFDWKHLSKKVERVLLEATE